MTDTIAPVSPPNAAEPAAPARTLADDLQSLLDHAAGRPITLGAMINVLGDRGHAVLIIILTAPFLVLPIPGISTAFGAALFVLGVCVTLNLRPWLPKFIARREISNDRLQRLVHGVERVLKKVERLIVPRWSGLTSRAWYWSIGLSLCAAAIALALPLPIPGNNIPPAIVLIILAFGLLERDGLAILIGHALNLIMWAVLYFMGDFLINAVEKVWQTLT